MSAIKEVLLYALAAEAGYGDNVAAYLRELKKRDDMDQEYEEYLFHKSINDGTYFEVGYEEVD